MTELLSSITDLMPALFTATAAIMMFVGAVTCLLASLGLLIFPDFFSRTHAAAKSGPLGAGIIILAVAIESGKAGLLVHGVIAFLFLILTAPVGAHLLARTAYIIGEKKVILKSDGQHDHSTSDDLDS